MFKIVDTCLIQVCNFTQYQKVFSKMIIGLGKGQWFNMVSSDLWSFYILCILQDIVIQIVIYIPKIKTVLLILTVNMFL